MCPTPQVRKVMVKFGEFVDEDALTSMIGEVSLLPPFTFSLWNSSELSGIMGAALLCRWWAGSVVTHLLFDAGGYGW